MHRVVTWILLFGALGCHGGGCHGHSFDDAEKWAKHFEDSARDEWQQPGEVITALRLQPDMHIADIGSATGYFPVRVARAVPAGRVWGVDIEPDMVRYLNRRARKEGIDNLFSILGRPEDPLLPEPVDLVLIVDTYHHIGERLAYFRQLAQHLRSGGRVAVIDFKKGDLPVGPPDWMKLAPEDVQAELEVAGYEMAESHDFLSYQYFLVFARKETQ